MPQWIYNIDLKGVFHNEELTFEERRDAIVRILRKSRWVKRKDGAVDHLPALIDELADTTNVDEFDSVWGAVYNEADTDRAWIATI
jgi:hypothetical protein